MENTQHTIIPRNIISFLSTSRCGEYYSFRCADKNNKIKKILQSYGLWGGIDAKVLEFIPTRYGGCDVYEMKVSSSKFVNNEFHAIYDSEREVHYLPTINISVEEFVKLYNEYEDFEIINNSYGIPSIIFGRTANNNPIVMPIINWDNLPGSINPYGEPRKEEFDSFVEIALPPQMLHKIEVKEVKGENGSRNVLYFAPETALSFSYDTRQEAIQKQIDEFFKGCKFFDIPIACTPRRYKLSDAEKLIRMTKVDQAYKMFVQQENLIMPLIFKNQDLTKKLATALQNEKEEKTKQLREISRSLEEVRYHTFYQDTTPEQLRNYSSTSSDYDPDLYAADYSLYHGGHNFGNY